MHDTQKNYLSGVHPSRRTLDEVLDRIETRLQQNKPRVSPMVIPVITPSHAITEKQSGIHELAQQVKEDAGKDIDFGDLLSGLDVGEDDDDLMSNDAEINEMEQEDHEFADIQRMIDGHTSTAKRPTSKVTQQHDTVSEDDEMSAIQKMLDKQADQQETSGDFNELLGKLTKKK